MAFKSGKPLLTAIEPDDYRMPLGDHIEELRKCLIQALIGVLIAVIVCFFFGFQIISWLVQPLLQVMHLRGIPPQVYTSDATAGFGTYIKVSLVAAVIVSSPWLIYQAWRFVATGLYSHEKRIIHILAPFSTVMTIIAVLFAYYLLIPSGLWFFFGWANKYPAIQYTHANPWIEALAVASGVDTEKTTEFDQNPWHAPVLEQSPEQPSPGDIWINGQSGKLQYFVNDRVYSAAISPTSMLATIPTLNQYVSFVSMIALGVVVAFQTPVFMLVLGWLGTVDPKLLAKSRRYAILICAVAGAVLTPSDIITMLLLSLPLYVLFEFGLFLMRVVYKEPEPFDPSDPFGIRAAEEELSQEKPQPTTDKNADSEPNFGRRTYTPQDVDQDVDQDVQDDVAQDADDLDNDYGDDGSQYDADAPLDPDDSTSPESDQGKDQVKDQDQAPPKDQDKKPPINPRIAPFEDDDFEPDDPRQYPD